MSHLLNLIHLLFSFKVVFLIVIVLLTTLYKLLATLFFLKFWRTLFIYFLFNFALIDSRTHDLPKLPIAHRMLAKNSQVKSTGFIINIWQSMRVGKSSLFHVQLAGFVVHFSHKSFIALSFRRVCKIHYWCPSTS